MTQSTWPTKKKIKIPILKWFDKQSSTVCEMILFARAAFAHRQFAASTIASKCIDQVCWVITTNFSFHLRVRSFIHYSRTNFSSIGSHYLPHFCCFCCCRLCCLLFFSCCRSVSIMNSFWISNAFCITASAILARVDLHFSAHASVFTTYTREPIHRRTQKNEKTANNKILVKWIRTRKMNFARVSIFFFFIFFFLHVFVTSIHNSPQQLVNEKTRSHTTNVWCEFCAANTSRLATDA